MVICLGRTVQGQCDRFISCPDVWKKCLDTSNFSCLIWIGAKQTIMLKLVVRRFMISSLSGVLPVNEATRNKLNDCHDLSGLHTACRKPFHHTNSEKKIALVLELFPLFGDHHSCSKTKTEMRQLIGMEFTDDWLCFYLLWVILIWLIVLVREVFSVWRDGALAMTHVFTTSWSIGSRARVNWCPGQAMSWS